MQRLTSHVSAQTPSPWRLKCQAWNSGCALEAGLIGRCLRPPSFMCLTGLRASTDRFNRPRRRHSDRGLNARVIPGFFRKQVYLLSTVQRFSCLPFKVFQNGWGFTDLATKPAPFWLSRHVTNTVPNHIHRVNKKFAVYDFQSICNLNHIVHTYLIY